MTKFRYIEEGKNSMKTKKTYLNKSCEWCLENWYDGKNYVTKTCDFHQKYNYQRKLDELKQDRKDLITWRIVSLFIITLCIFELSFGIFMLGKSILSGLLLIVQGLIFTLAGLWLLKDNEESNGKCIRKDLEELKEWKEVNGDHD